MIELGISLTTTSTMQTNKHNHRQVIFPEGTPGSAVDALARLPLWAEGLNYRHGTGHGVGAALNVHEGPQSISTRYWITTPLQVRKRCSRALRPCP